MMHLTDKEIIDGLRSKDERISSLVHKKYFPMCTSIVCYKGGSIEDAEDVFQEAMCSILQKLAKQEFEIRCAFKSYVFAVFFNLWKLQLERKRRHNRFELTAIPEPLAEQVIEEFDRQLCSSVLWTCYQELREKCRIILKMVWQGYPLKEIAVILSVDYDRFRRIKYDCHHSLSVIIKNSDSATELLKNEFPELYSVLK
ncbi:MAG: sigma-70 family RNA polymerase sigma factor [Bacteroidales bacterium]|nr:sigma-70 family RNA polymerase sigma factor [Bacteroidales bacterium]